MTTPTAPGIERASTARHFLTTVSVNGRSLGQFDRMSGGNTVGESVKHTVKGVRRVALGGGPIDNEDVTVGRAFVHTRDHALARELRPLVNTASVVISRQPLDAENKPYGRPETHTGVLTGVTYPDYDADSSELSELALMVAVDGEVG